MLLIVDLLKQMVKLLPNKQVLRSLLMVGVQFHQEIQIKQPILLKKQGVLATMVSQYMRLKLLLQWRPWLLQKRIQKKLLSIAKDIFQKIQQFLNLYLIFKIGAQEILIGSKQEKKQMISMVMKNSQAVFTLFQIMH